jgi:hypothetical protein
MGRGLSRRQLRPSEKGDTAVGKTKRGKGTNWMLLVDGEGFPLGVLLESASPVEVTLAEATLAEVGVPRRPKGRPRQKPERVIAAWLRFRSAAPTPAPPRNRPDRALSKE